MANNKKEIERRIFLKRQLIKLSEIEVEVLEDELEKMGDRETFLKTGNPEPASPRN